MIPEAREQERDSKRAVRMCIATLKADDSSVRTRRSSLWVGVDEGSEKDRRN